MRIAFVQMNCRFGEKEKNLVRAIKLIQNHSADLYVLPELFNSGYLFESRQEVLSCAEAIPEGDTCRQLIQTAGERKTYISAGLAEKENGRLYNASVLTGPDGYIGRYRKIHLFDEEKLWFDPGDRTPYVYNIGMARIGMMICFDWIFPETMRSLALQGADIICHSANLVMPYCQSAMVTRCLENGVFAITANRVGRDVKKDRQLTFTGKSQITGPRGQILARASRTLEEVGVATIDVKEAGDKWLNKRNHLLDDRRPDLYRL